MREVNAVFDMGVLEPVRAHTKKPIPTMMVYDDVKVKAIGGFDRYMKQPRTLHLKAAMDILKYLAATKLMGIEYGGQRDTFVGYSDSDLGSCRDDSRSTTGFAFMLNEGEVS
ncbi:hypothetical protein CEUSTIGMA_g5253.t1 [Chlamydomonas eustigma]|uniref:Reverse transcriptase Ty1/copia-type domain-containing protein n=1 Tax=Chlamydomonas eustigma TaxID=1157962 RepID=A0A250X4X3_9CHLO|nr:hypothetical protein CEUSTIGMA_g5253.t1 [Chlamydomonas eustigma]|eukprot:GAX77810.1 hypothetical protein CEUSTIGMA_g5253.t1 [Chlamydomonas eustigma]